MNKHKVIRLAFILIISLSNNSYIYSQNEPLKKGSLITQNNSRIITYDLPEKLTPGQDYTATVTMLNTGKSKWTKLGNYYLGNYNESDTNTGTDLWGVNRVELTKDVIPSGEVIFLFKVTAPKIPGVYKMRWAMLKDDNFFGEYTDNTVDVNNDTTKKNADAEGNNSEVISLRIAETMIAGEKYKVTLTLKNTGNRTWHASEYSDFKISPFTETSDIIYPDWNSTSYYLSSSIEPDQTSDVEFYVVAPSSPGAYSLQWMMKSGSGYFGRKTDRVTVQVVRNSTSLADERIFNSTFSEQSVPNSMTLNENYEITVTMNNTGSKTWIRGEEKMVMIDPKHTPATINQWNVGYLPLPQNVDPGNSVTFRFTVKPIETGWQYFQCSMMNESGKLFGSPTKSVEVIVTKRQ